MAFIPAIVAVLIFGVAFFFVPSPGKKSPYERLAERNKK